MERFLHFSYFFTPRPDPNFPYTKLTLALILLLVLGGVALNIYRKKRVRDEIKKKLLRRAPSLLQLYGALLLLLLFFRESGIPYLSMRVWWLLLFGFFIHSSLKFIFGFQRGQNRRPNETVYGGV